jgi:hypothetical protein
MAKAMSRVCAGHSLIFIAGAPFPPEAVAAGLRHPRQSQKYIGINSLAPKSSLLNGNLGDGHVG